MTYDIIQKNLQKLEDAVKTFPDILGKFRETTDILERNRLSSLAQTLGLTAYVDFIKWTEHCRDTNQQIIATERIQFESLKKKIHETASDDEVKRFFNRRSLKGFIEFLQSSKFTAYDGGNITKVTGYSYRKRRDLTKTKYFENNFYKTKVDIINWAISKWN